MKKMSRRFLLAGCVGLALAGCRPAAPPTPSPLDWLQEQPFEPAPSEWPDVITSGLPEGFEVEDPYFESEELPSGEDVQIARVGYQRAVGGQVKAENYVEVNVFGFWSAEARAAFLDMLAAEDYEWSFEQLGGAQVARYREYDLDGRIWVSGPYLIVVYISAEDRGPLVDAFAELYLAQPPSPGAYSSPSPLDWLREQPFEPAPPGWPDVITSGLPEGFNVLDPDDETQGLPSGEAVQVTRVVYQRPVGGRVGAEDRVEVNVVGLQTAEGRSELLDMLAEGEDYEWSLVQLSGGQVVRYYTSGVDGRVWVSGPYLIWLFSGDVEGRGPWVDTFTELYLAQPPVPGVGGTLLDWLRAKAFEPAPSERPVFITSGLPEGFEVEDPQFETGELPSGEAGEMAWVTYSLVAEDWVQIRFCAFGSAAGRSEFLDMLADAGELPSEPRDWGPEQFSGGEVARYGRRGWDEGRTWVSGPYLIMVVSQVEEPGLWMETFTELYLAQYPAE